MEEVALVYGVFRVLRFSQVSFLLPLLHIRLHLHVALTRMTNGNKAWEPSKKQWSFGNRVALDIKVLSLSGHLKSTPTPLFDSDFLTKPWLAFLASFPYHSNLPQHHAHKHHCKTVQITMLLFKGHFQCCIFFPLKSQCFPRHFIFTHMILLLSFFFWFSLRRCQHLRIDSVLAERLMKNELPRIWNDDVSGLMKT